MYKITCITTNINMQIEQLRVLAIKKKSNGRSIDFIIKNS